MLIQPCRAAACEDRLMTTAKVEKKLETANQFGVEEIARAKQLSDGGDVEGARKILKQIYADYKGLACSKEAETALAALPKDK